MKTTLSTITIDQVTITELPSAVEHPNHRSLLARFERYTREHRLRHLVILPNEVNLDLASLAFLTEIKELVDIAGGEIGLVAWRTEMRRILQASGIDGIFKCFSSVSAGVEALAPPKPRRHSFANTPLGDML